MNCEDEDGGIVGPGAFRFSHPEPMLGPSEPGGIRHPAHPASLITVRVGGEKTTMAVNEAQWPQGAQPETKPETNPETNPDPCFAADPHECLDLARAAGTLPNLHGVVAMQGGRIVFERYLAGPDSARTRPLGIVRFGPDTLHDLRSVTKSIVGLLYGIALAAGRVPAPEESLLARFPDYPDLAADPARRRLTVAHALTMTLGTEWDELSIPYSDPRNGETAMERAPDRYRHVLDRPILGPPGTVWTYNGGATALLARLIARGTARPLHEFAREVLFAPLGIARTEWARGADGEEIAASGLRMAPRDLARIGAMALAGGQWHGRQVVPASWLAASFAPAVALPDGRRYGYHWYLGEVPAAAAGGTRWDQMILAIGNGGQRLFLLPRRDLAIAVTAGNYDAPNQSAPATTVLRDVLLPAMRPAP
jgi:CubicO group peptidase (beta-lactamase class C family)